MDVTLALTGHRRGSHLDRYLAMALHYASWTLDDATLSDHEALISGRSPDSGAQLLEALSFQATYAMRAEKDNLPDALLVRSQSAAKEWRRSLSAADIDVIRLHHRAVQLLERTLSSDEDSQRMLVAELQVAVMPRAEEPVSDVSPSSAYDMRHFQSGDAHPRRPSSPDFPSRGMRVFAGPAEALAFFIQNASGLSPAAMLGHGATLSLAGGTASPGAPAPLRAPSQPSVTVTGARLKVFSPSDAFGVLQRMPPPAPSEGNNQQRRVLETMSADLGVRALTETPDGEPLAELYGRFPHFTPVLDYISRSLAMAACGDTGKPVRIAPFLLRSEPGIGKTYFAQELARVLGAYFVERDLAVVSEAFVLSGMDSSWKGSKPGVVFEAVVNGKTANPIICLNEVDKARVTGTHSSPLAALYSLLEPTSAERFQDEFVPVNIDASAVVWVLTANDGHVPDPILSRLEVFDIPRPTQEQCRAIAQSVWASISTKSLPAGHGFPAELAPEVLNAVSALSPRVMRKTLTKAVGEAAFFGRKELARADLDAAAASAASSGGRSIGFLA